MHVACTLCIMMLIQRLQAVPHNFIMHARCAVRKPNFEGHTIGGTVGNLLHCCCATVFPTGRAVQVLCATSPLRAKGKGLKIEYERNAHCTHLPETSRQIFYWGAGKSRAQSRAKPGRLWARSQAPTRTAAPQLPAQSRAALPASPATTSQPALLALLRCLWLY
jgi:hypothetical protein